MNKPVIVVFVCHNIETLGEALCKSPNAHIIFVGDKEVNETIRNNPNIIIAREQPNHIEDEKKLLTFTAWYLIIKNNLYKEYEYICVLEYDVTLQKDFEQNLTNMLGKNLYDIISFKEGHSCFTSDIDMGVLKIFLENKSINYELYKNCRTLWYPSTNQCINRKILNDFVDWYYPDYLQIKEQDLKKLPWYHERLFSVYIRTNDFKIYVLNGLTHFCKNSHKKGFN